MTKNVFYATHLATENYIAEVLNSARAVCQAANGEYLVVVRLDPAARSSMY